MKTGTKIILGVALVIIILSAFFILNFFGFLTSLNPITNYLIAGSPDKSCSNDNDCVFKRTTCSSTLNSYCGDTVNKEWNTFCPFSKRYHTLVGVVCTHREARCIDNICQKISPTYCQTDEDCACGVHSDTGDCFYGNNAYVITSLQCPDFCNGIAGNFEIKCVENKCTQVSTRQL